MAENAERPTVEGAGQASASLGAYVTIKYRCANICAPEDLSDAGMTFDEMVRLLIDEEGSVEGVAGGPGTIITIEQFDDAAPPTVGRAPSDAAARDPQGASNP